MYYYCVYYEFLWNRRYKLLIERCKMKIHVNLLMCACCVWIWFADIHVDRLRRQNIYSVWKKSKCQKIFANVIFFCRLIRKPFYVLCIWIGQFNQNSFTDLLQFRKAVYWFTEFWIKLPSFARFANFAQLTLIWYSVKKFWTFLPQVSFKSIKVCFLWKVIWKYYDLTASNQDWGYFFSA